MISEMYNNNQLRLCSLKNTSYANRLCGFVARNGVCGGVPEVQFPSHVSFFG